MTGAVSELRPHGMVSYPSSSFHLEPGALDLTQTYLLNIFTCTHACRHVCMFVCSLSPQEAEGSSKACCFDRCGLAPPNMLGKVLSVLLLGHESNR